MFDRWTTYACRLLFRLASEFEGHVNITGAERGFQPQRVVDMSDVRVAVGSPEGLGSCETVIGARTEPLWQLEVLVVDCQATAAAPRGHLLEIGWARVLRATITHAHASLIALTGGEQIPSAVGRITGISEHMLRDAVPGHLAWRELSDQAADRLRG